MIKVILNDGTVFSDNVKSINTMSMTMKDTKTETVNITIFFESSISEEDLKKFTTSSCEKITIVDSEGVERDYEGFNTSISAGRTISATDSICNVTLTK